MSSLSHEVNNALAVLMMNLDFACDDRPASAAGVRRAPFEEQLEVLADARDAARRLQELLRGALPGESS